MITFTLKEPVEMVPLEAESLCPDTVAALDNGVWLDPRLGFRAIESSRIDAWRMHLDAAQIDAINAACRDHSGYCRLGYRFD